MVMEAWSWTKHNIEYTYIYGVLDVCLVVPKSDVLQYGAHSKVRKAITTMKERTKTDLISQSSLW